MSVMGAKLNTKTWADAPQTKPTSENSMSQTVSATDKDKINGENIGEALNKISDPNYIDPKKKMRATGNNKLDKDAFFKLMIANMKNQDPTNPLKSHEMAAQLANFSSLEQMQNMNTTLGEIKAGQKPSEQFQSLSLIGKAVSGDSSKLVRAKGDTDHDFQFNLPADAKEVSVKVLNAAGEEVRKYDLANLKKGDNKITWNGHDSRDNVVPVGEYRFAIEAKGSNGTKLAVKTDFSGMITGVNYTPEGPVLMIGNQTIRLRDVRKITDPSLMKNDQKAQNVVPQDLKTPGAVKETKKEANEGAPEPAPVAGQLNNIDSVGMSSEVMAQIQKEVSQGT
jgi:flagellar basal-body rod modification protein FlgD